MKTASEIISWLFLPLLMPVYALLIVMYFPSTSSSSIDIDNLYNVLPQFKKGLLGMFTILTVFAPAVSFVLLKRAGYISSIEMEEKDERQAPIVIMMIYCALLYMTLRYITFPENTPKFVYSLPISGIGVTLVFLFWNKISKISIHAAGTGILTGFILAYNANQVLFNPLTLVIAFLVSGIVLSARMYLGKHTLSQSVIGWSIGFVITVFTNI